MLFVEYAVLRLSVTRSSRSKLTAKCCVFRCRDPPPIISTQKHARTEPTQSRRPTISDFERKGKREGTERWLSRLFIFPKEKALDVHRLASGMNLSILLTSPTAVK
jgi:hypothetical protein